MDNPKTLVDVLVIDDDELVLERHRRYFDRNPGFNSRLTTDPDEARRVVETCVVNYIVTDYRMPTQLGTALLDELAGLNKNPLTQYVLCSASALAPAEQRSLDLLPINVIEKDELLTREGLERLASELTRLRSQDAPDIAC